MKRIRTEAEHEAAGVIESYDPDTQQGKINLGDGESAVFELSTFARGGFSRIKVGAPLKCRVVPSDEGNKVVSIWDYHLKSNQIQQR